MDKNEDKYEIGDNLDNLVTEYEEELKKTYDSLSRFYDKSVGTPEVPLPGQARH